MNRRKFLTRAVQGAAVAAVVTRRPASFAQSVPGANERVNLALIGCGGRGRLLARQTLQVPNVAFVAFCDVYDPHAQRAREEYGAAGAETYRDFRRALDRNDVDAVVVATPDHWHAIPTVLACQAGKDVLVEKPLGHNIREGGAMVEAARRYDRVVQHGTQHRAAPHYKEVEEIVQSGQIGEVRFVRVWNYSAPAAGSAAPAADPDPPEELDWDFFLGPAPLVPYHPQRFRGHRRFFDYAGGFITDFGTHRLDSVHQVMHDERPLSATANGGLYDPRGTGDTPNVLHVTYEYRGWVLSYEGIQMNRFGTGPRMPGGRVPYNASQDGHDRPHGEAFYGTNGTIFSDRVGYEVFPPERDSSLKPSSVEGRDCTDLLVRDFIECVRSRRQPVADVEIGHRSSIVPHLGNISYRVGGRKIRWDAEREQIINDPEASVLLGREARKRWDLI